MKDDFHPRKAIQNLSPQNEQKGFCDETKPLSTLQQVCLNKSIRAVLTALHKTPGTTDKQLSFNASQLLAVTLPEAWCLNAH